uniref:Tissue factor n=2 Tax=Oreochromis niloticus TaxID=8128 RepID=A0A669F376_ORENI
MMFGCSWTAWCFLALSAVCRRDDESCPPVTMACLPLLLCLSLLLRSELAHPPPAPVNLSVNSLNFRHVLRWKPSNNTPPGTEYGVFVSDDRETWEQQCNIPTQPQCNLTSGTSMSLMLPDWEFHYYLHVKAFFNQTWSPESGIIEFVPYAQTKLGPPEFSLVGYENYIQINISLPRVDDVPNFPGIQECYGASFRVSFRIGTDGEISTLETENKSLTLENLKRGAEYCIQVKLNIRNLNNHEPEPSAWKCTFTTAVDQQRGLTLGLVIGVPMVAIFIVTSCLLLLFYTGVICKLKETVPRALITALTKGYVLTPQPTVPDPISVTSETGEHNNHTTSPSANIDDNSEDDDDDDGNLHYVNRAVDLSSGESCCCQELSGNMSTNSEPTAALDAGSSRLFAKVKVTALPAESDEGQVETEVEGAQLCLVKERSRSGVWGQSQDEEVVKSKEDEEVRDISGNINLFSVTLASMAARDEDEEDVTGFLKESSLEGLPATDSQTEPGDHLTPQVFPTHRDRTASRREGDSTDTLTEEEEEEFSPYLRNR